MASASGDMSLVLDLVHHCRFSLLPDSLFLHLLQHMRPLLLLLMLLMRPFSMP